MAATTPKKRKVARKQAKQYTMVTFELPQFDGSFELPDLKHLPLRVMDALNKGQIGVLGDWLREADIHEDYLEAILDLGQDEVEELIETWGKGSMIDAPKSKD